jgi:hypothetical protein
MQMQMLVLVVLALLATHAIAYPTYFSSSYSKSCMDYPMKGYKGHGAPKNDRFASSWLPAGDVLKVLSASVFVVAAL